MAKPPVARKVWVMKDRANGDADLLWPTYVWMHTSKVMADAQYRDHQKNDCMVPLTVPQEVSLKWLQNRYTFTSYGGGNGNGVYLTKKKGEGKR